MKAAALFALLVVSGCAALEGQVPALDTAATAAMQTGGCIKLVCALPLSDCRLRPGRCHRH